MAKKTGKDSSKRSQPAAVVMSAAAESKLENFADDLGKLLGQAQNKAENWLGQRKAIAEQLMGVRDTAVRLLSQLGVGESNPVRAAKRVAKAGGGPASGASVRRKKRTMSAEARARISAAQKARWAKQKKANG